MEGGKGSDGNGVIACLRARAMDREGGRERERGLSSRLPRGGGPSRYGRGTEGSKEYYTCRCNAGC